MSRRSEVPKDFEADCDNCRWHLENFPREDLYLFHADGAFLQGRHVNVTEEAFRRLEESKDG